LNNKQNFWQLAGALEADCAVGSFHQSSHAGILFFRKIPQQPEKEQAVALDLDRVSGLQHTRICFYPLPTSTLSDNS